jgi:propionate CoA-transferase
VVERMAFAPRVAAELKTMDARLFRPEPMGLAADLRAQPRRARSSRLESI